MLVGHLLWGHVLGVLFAVASLFAGFPLWATLGLYVLGVNAGFVASLLVAALAGREAEGGRSHDASEPLLQAVRLTEHPRPAPPRGSLASASGTMGPRGRARQGSDRQPSARPLSVGRERRESRRADSALSRPRAGRETLGGNDES